MRRCDHADDVADVERRERDLVQLRRQVEHDHVASTASEIDGLLYGRDADELRLLGGRRGGKDPYAALVVSEVQREILLGDTGDVSARVVNDRRARTEIEEHRSVPELQIQIKEQDRKSTRLNSSHVSISYAVFCLKKKKDVRADDRVDYQMAR